MKDYDYSLEGAYYVTICLQQKLCLFWDIVDDAMVLNDAGRMTETVLEELAARFENVEIFDYVIMPNHIHIIVQIETKKTVVSLFPVSESLNILVFVPMAVAKLQCY